MTTRLVPRPPYVETARFTTQPEPFTPSLIVLHDTEGGTPRSVVTTLHGKGYGIHWITGQNGAIIRGTIDQHVYHCGDYNGRAIGIEQCGFARWSHADWMTHPTELLATAWIVAFDAQRWGIPIQLVTPRSPHDPVRGITTHAALGIAGGGHSDPGDGYPLSHVLGMAVSIQARGLGLRERARVALACRRVT